MLLATTTVQNRKESIQSSLLGFVVAYLLQDELSFWGEQKHTKCTVEHVVFNILQQVGCKAANKSKRMALALRVTAADVWLELLPTDADRRIHLHSFLLA